MTELPLNQQLTQILECCDVLETDDAERTTALGLIRGAVKFALSELMEDAAGAEQSAVATLEAVTPEINRIAGEQVETADTIPPPSGTHSKTS